jgi:probable HAF family extracellular repeat protein
MQRKLAVALAAVLLIACRDGARPLAPVADVVTPYGSPSEYQPIALQLPGDYTRGVAVAINNHNQVVAYTETVRDGLLESSRAFLWDNGTVQDLGTLGPANTIPSDINDRGQIVGWSRGDFVSAAHAFFWDHGTMQDLGEVLVYGSDQPRFNHVRINDRGQVLGNRPGGQAFLWENGVTQTVTLDFATALNDRGQVAGWVWRNSSGIRLRRAAVWEDGVVTELGTLGGADSWANAISHTGWVVGGSRTGPNEFGNPEMHAFRWREGRMEDLGRSGETSSGRPEGWQATLVNDPGQVGAKSNDVSFFWDHGVTQSIICRCGSFYPMDMNLHGTIVGWGGWVWNDGVLHNLEGEAGHRAIGINDQGAVVGYQLTVPMVWLPVRH